MPKPIQKDMNFGDTMFLHYLEPEKCQKSYPETTRISAMPEFFTTLSQQNAKTNQKTRISYQTALIDPSNNAKESIHFPEFCTSFEIHSLNPSTLTKNNNLGTPSSMIPQLQTNCDTFGQ